MSCQEAQALLNAYVDGELDLVRSLEIEKHLEGCPACARTVENHQTLGNALRAGSHYYQAPPRLEHRIRAALPRSKRISWPLAAVAASLLLAGIFVDRMVESGSRRNLVAQEVLDSHLRSLMPGHLADVESTDRHTVKPWFAGKLDFSPPVADFAEQGFPLTGGRLDSVNGRNVAVLVYRRHQHLINAYTWPSAGSPDSAVGKSALQGYNLLHWTRGGVTWWLASDLNSNELESLANLLRGP
jgi:anti-sigma factor RsiW